MKYLLKMLCENDKWGSFYYLKMVGCKWTLYRVDCHWNKIELAKANTRLEMVDLATNYLLRISIYGY